MELFKWDEVTPEAPEGMPGVKIYWVIDKKRGAENFAMRVLEVAPGATTLYHHHWYEQEMYFLEGQGVATSLEGDHPLSPGTVLWVRPDEPHAFKNNWIWPDEVYLLRPNEKAVRPSVSLPHRSVHVGRVASEACPHFRPPPARCGTRPSAQRSLSPCCGEFRITPPDAGGSRCSTR